MKRHYSAFLDSTSGRYGTLKTTNTEVKSNLLKDSPSSDFLSSTAFFDLPGLKTQPLTVTHSGQTNRTDFHMTTQMVKRLTHIFDTFKENVDCNLEFLPKGIQLFALYSGTTACVFIKLQKNLFSEYKCERNTVVCLNFGVLAKKLTTLYKFRPRTLEFSNLGGSQLVLGAVPDNRKPIKITLDSLEILLEALDVKEFKYDLLLKVKSTELANLLEAMSSQLSIQMDCDSHSLIFESRDDTSISEMSLPLDPETADKCKKYPQLRSYKQNFLKSNLAPLIRSTKLTTHVLIGLHMNYPLYATFTLSEYFDQNGPDNSEVCMYFSPMVDTSYRIT